MRRQCTGDQRHRVGEPGLQRLPENVDALRQLNPVEAELQIGVVAAHMQLAKRILRNTRSLEQELVQRLIVALRLRFDRLPTEIVDGGAEVWLDLGTRDVELLGDDVEVERNPACGRRRLLRGGGTGSKKRCQEK